MSKSKKTTTGTKKKKAKKRLAVRKKINMAFLPDFASSASLSGNTEVVSLVANPRDPAAFASISVTGFGAMYNPDTNIGGIRLMFSGHPPKDFNQLRGDVFAAAFAILSMGGANYNGQYLMITR